MLLTGDSLESVVLQAALLSNRKDGHKWKGLMHLLWEVGLRGYGAVVDDLHNLGTRAAQLMAERRFPGFDKRARPEIGVFVLTGEAASRDASDPDFLRGAVVPALVAELRRIGQSGLKSVIVFRSESGRVVPRILLQSPSAPAIVAKLYPHVSKATDW